MPQPRKHASPAARQAAYLARCKQAHQEQLAARSLPALPALPTMPGEARWSVAIQEAQHRLQGVYDEMQTYFDERSDTWQESDRGERFAEREQMLEELLAQLQELGSAFTWGPQRR